MLLTVVLSSKLCCFIDKNIGIVWFSHSVVSTSLWPDGLQHTRLPCPSPTHGACSNSCPSSQWCHPTISSSVTPFSSCLHCFPASGSFPRSQFFASGGQSTGALASVSVLSLNIQGWFHLGLTGMISLLSQGLSQLFPLLWPARKYSVFNRLMRLGQAHLDTLHILGWLTGTSVTSAESLCSCTWIRTVLISRDQSPVAHLRILPTNILFSCDFSS